jgi:hypothetical protein
MNGNIESELGLSDHNQTVNAKGWLEFEGNEQRATLTVKFTQNGVWGTRSQVYNKPPGKNRVDWQFDVTAANGGTFLKTLAHGRADADVTQPVNSLDAGWDKDVQLG